MPKAKRPKFTRRGSGHKPIHPSKPKSKPRSDSYFPTTYKRTTPKETTSDSKLKPVYEMSGGKEIFMRYESEDSELNNSPSNISSSTSGWKVFFIILIIVLAFIFVVIPMIKTLGNMTKDVNTQSKPTPTATAKPTPTATPDPIIVTGTKTDVIITNNLNRAISLNVTYRIHSRWFGIDVIKSQVFDVDAGEKKSFMVYNNAGCSTAPCSVSIVRFEEV